MAALLLPGGAQAIAPKTQFSYTGGEQSYVVPPGVVLLGVAAEGGLGGPNGGNGGSAGGVGALLPVTPGQKLFAEVGSAGVYDGGAVFGGGGAAGPPPPVVTRCPNPNGSPCNFVYAGSGGGASDVRTCSISSASCTGGVGSASTRLIVGGGGGGMAGSGNAPGDACSASGVGAGANTFQYPPGNPGAPLPIITAAGIVYPGRSTTESDPVITPAGGGSNIAGTGGVEGGCTAGGGGSATFSDSVARSNAVGPAGGSGGNASSLGPMFAGCSMSIGNCYDAGPGGGGGGGYFGGGGGGTGLDKETGGQTCPCDNATSGQGGGAGSSFVSNQTTDPINEAGISGTTNGIVVMVPVIEIDAPANGAAFTPGQVVDASWGCGFDPTTLLGIGSGCTGTVANGSPIDTSPGTHTFIVSGTVSSNGVHTVSASVTYTVKAGGGGKHVSASAGGFTFTLTGPGSSVKKGSKLTVTLTNSGKGKQFKVGQYMYYLKGTHKHPTLVTKHAGTFSLSLNGLGSGNHTLTVVITLNSTKHHGKSKTATLKLPFTIR